GAHLKPITHVFLGWFGPRGLATVLYGLLILEEYATPHSDELFTVAILTVLFSVVAHGMSAAPGARAYARTFEDAKSTMPERIGVTHHPTR
ncbi:MAG: sodium:proton exchanger, partial [Nannocystaceae bacterium]